MITTRFQKLRLQAREAVPAGIYFMYRLEGVESFIPDFLVQFSIKNVGKDHEVIIMCLRDNHISYDIRFVSRVFSPRKERNLFSFFFPLTQLKKNACGLSM